MRAGLGSGVQAWGGLGREVSLGPRTRAVLVTQQTGGCEETPGEMWVGQAAPGRQRGAQGVLEESRAEAQSGGTRPWRGQVGTLPQGRTGCRGLSGASESCRIPDPTCIRGEAQILVCSLLTLHHVSPLQGPEVSTVEELWQSALDKVTN